MSHKISRKIHPTLLALLSITSNCMGSQEAPNMESFFGHIPSTSLAFVYDSIEQNPALVHMRNQDRETLLHLIPRISSWNRRTRTNRKRVTLAQFLLSHGSDVHAKNQKGETPLHTAAAHGHHALVQCLIEHGANVNAGEYNRETPLHQAAKHGHYNVVSVLLKSDADPNAWGIREETPLHMAAMNGHASIIQCLVHHGANVNATTRYGSTSLHWATTNNHERTARVLIELGADLNLTDHAFRTPLHWAIDKGNIALVRTLLGIANFDFNAPEAASTLREAEIVGHQAIAATLFPAEANKASLFKISVKTDTISSEEGITFFYYSIRKGHFSLALLLLEVSSNTEMPEFLGETERDRDEKQYAQLIATFNLIRFLPKEEAHNRLSIECIDLILLQVDAGRAMLKFFDNKDIVPYAHLPKDILDTILSFLILPDALQRLRVSGSRPRHSQAVTKQIQHHE